MTRPLRVAAAAGLVAIAALIVAPVAEAHSLRPGFVIVAETEAGVFDVQWTAPTAEPYLVPYVTGRCDLERSSLKWTLRCAEGDEPAFLVVSGFQYDSTEVVIRVAPLEGDPLFAMLGMDEDRFPLDLEAAAAEHGSSFSQWMVLGIEHILIGTDHLLFVLGLVLLITGFRQLLATITSFTLAHSITLGGASLGAFDLPSGPVEAVIALSIVLLAVELAHDTDTITKRKPWLVAFVFGLLHGFGFAGALGELGLPSESIWMPLLSFNLGVEAGQLTFVAIVLGPILLLRKAPRALQLVPVYGIGIVAMAWSIERVVGFWA